MKLCNVCGHQIPIQRLEVLPTATTCVKCSQEGKKAAAIYHTVENEDVQTSLHFVSQEEYRKIKEMERGYINGKSTDQ